jgi:uncharacterized protein (TIGR03546 family)
MFIVKILSKLLKALRSNAAPGQIAWGFALGMILGLTPFMSMHNLVVIFLITILNVNLSAVFLGLMVFSGFAYLLDPLFHSIGYFLLVEVNFLQGLWETMYNTPIIALSGFNNTVVLGSLVSSLLLLFPVFLFMKWFVVYYRENLESKVQKMKIVVLLKGSKLYKFYEYLS